MINRAIHIPVIAISMTLGVAAATSTAARTAPGDTWTGSSEGIIGIVPYVGGVGESYFPEGDFAVGIDEQDRNLSHDAIASPSDRSCWRKNSRSQCPP